ncbi:nucleotidyltransferase family protein [Prauserella endophytica]|nr:nucleotidyltransferase family protein [Prauserella endophytica]
MARRVCGEEHYPATLLAVAGHGLPGAARIFPAEPLGDKAWTALLAAAREHRVLGPLRQAVGEGRLPTRDRQAADARALHRAGLLRVLSLEQALLSLVRLLGEAGIDSRVLKGSAVARLDYREPALRSFIDLDVLVRAADFERAVTTLGTAGLVRTLAEPSPGFDRRFDKGTTLRHAAGYELDLHRTFVLGPWGRLVRLESLWDEGEAFELGGHQLRALSRRNRFLHACYHAALGDWPLRLGSLRDIAEMLRWADPDGAAILSIAREWGIQAVVAAAVADCTRLLGLPANGELTRWAPGYVPTRREVSWLALHTHANKTFAAQALATVRVLPWRDRTAYVRALLLPDAEYVAGRHRSALSRFGYAVREVRRGRAARS